MYQIIKIGGKDYKFEYSFEASMYSECVQAVMKIMTQMTNAEDFEALITGMGDLPKTALTCFYAGLLEHHGIEGDNAVPDIHTAKLLAKQWILEKGEDGNFYELLTLCIDQMGEDGFFKLVGLETILNPTEEEEQPKAPKAPQDHKGKTRKATEK